MKYNLLYITDLKNNKPHIEHLDKILNKFNLFLITQEENALKFWEMKQKKIRIINEIKFIKEIPNFKQLNTFYQEYFSKNEIHLLFLRFEGNRNFRFIKNSQYILPIAYAEKNNIPVYYGRTSETLMNLKNKKKEKQVNFKEGNGVIYTAVFGGYEDIFTPKFINKDIDYICFTDDTHLKSNVWDIRVINDLEMLDNTRKARTLKILPHKYLKEYDFSVWVDAGFEICDDVEKFLNRYSNGSKILSVKHTERDCIYDEAKVCISAKLDDEQLIKSQMDKYKSEGYPHDNGLIESGILYRQHNDPTVIKVMEDWYNEILNFSKRDQLSFNYATWKNKLKFDYAYVLYGKNQFFEHYYHLHLKSYQKTIEIFRILILDKSYETTIKIIQKINEINENIPISILTKKNKFNFNEKNIEIINFNEINPNDMNSYINDLNEKYLFIINSNTFINYNYFKKIYNIYKNKNQYDAIIFEEKHDNINNHSTFENIKYNAEGILFKKNYLNQIDIQNILNEEFIKQTVNKVKNKKLIII